MEFRHTFDIFQTLNGEQFTDIEYHPVKEEDGHAEQCEPKETQYWSVYIRLAWGGLECIADCETEQDAKALHDLLTKLCPLYKQETAQTEKPRIVIEIEEGVLQSVCSTTDIEYLLVDIDDIKHSLENEHELTVREQDSLFKAGEANLLYKDGGNIHKEVEQKLKKVEF